MLRTDGGYGVPGMPGNTGAFNTGARTPSISSDDMEALMQGIRGIPTSPRFNPNELNVKPSPGYLSNPNYNPFHHEQDRDRFILHDPRSGVANNPNPLQDPRFKIQGGESPYRQPVLPTERSPEEDIPFLLPGQPQLPMAYGSSNLPGAVGNMGGIQNAQFFRGPQMGQVPPGFQGKYVS